MMVFSRRVVPLKRVVAGDIESGRKSGKLPRRVAGP